ncbi:MAG TPA: ribonucleoside hydrolase [Anaerolineae bacterium]|nr:ribonucleoside hydrolase [Anaerolineae bacterium]
MAQKVILDVDTGGDDGVALLLAGHHPALDLAAVTPVHGNAPLPVTLDNTLRVLEAGKLTHIPVYAGSHYPIVAPALETSATQRATLPLPAPSMKQQAKGAVDFLIEYYLGADGPDTIYMPLGPQTNLALALRIEPVLAERIPRIVTMAGAYLEGNTTPSAEFNILADPEAASIVFRSGIPISMIGLEVTASALVTAEDVDKVRKLNTLWAEAAALLMYRDVKWFRSHWGWKGGQIFDAVAVASVIDPDLVKTCRMHVEIELRGEYTRGRTVADISGRHGHKKNVDVGLKADRGRFLQILMEGLA